MDIGYCRQFNENTFTKLIELNQLKVIWMNVSLILSTNLFY